MTARIAAAIVACALTGAAAEPLSVPFDFSRHAIGLTVVIKGKPLYFLLDTGVNPSVVDLARAEALGLPLDRKAAGEGNGEGPGTAPEIPGTIPSPEIGGRKFANVEVLATDMSAMSAAYGRALDGVLGYSFLSANSVLIDYQAHKVTIGTDGKGQDPAAQCRKTYSLPFMSNDDDQFPVLRAFRFGGVEAPVTLDTGSNRAIGLYQAALRIPAIRKALIYRGAEQGNSFGGSYTTRDAILTVPMSIGPFVLPAGQAVSVMPGKGLPGKRIANVGNGFLAALKVQLLVDYPHKRIVFLRDCAK